MRQFYSQLNCHSGKWPNNANTRVASLSVVLYRNNSVTSMRAPEVTFGLGYRHKIFFSPRLSYEEFIHHSNFGVCG